ncbi:hypothetical protein OF83DRAFT_1092323 [Amylostereum chailletii]|nr:hypothetical protein OF83DRAFT_1092323 [Amylostereum chailletii]
MSHSQHSFTCTHKSPSTTHHLPPLRSLDLRTFYKPHGAYASACLQRLEPTGIPVNIYKGSARQSFIQRGLLGNRPFTYLSTSWNIWRGFLAEMRLLSHPRYLRPLQGVCVPFVIGVLRSTRGLVDVVTELPHVTGWRTARPSMPTSEKLSILKAYELIHDQGVLHGSVALCNMLVGDVGNITILDYKRAACLDTHAIPDLETCKPHELDFELRKVKFLLDIHGARANEYHLAQYTTHEGRVRPYSRHYLHPGDPFYIREETLRQWEAVAQEEDESSTVYNVPEQYRFSPSGCSIRRILATIGRRASILSAISTRTWVVQWSIKSRLSFSACTSQSYWSRPCIFTCHLRGRS